MNDQHGTEPPTALRFGGVYDAPSPPEVFRVPMHRAAGPVACPVLNCPASEAAHFATPPQLRKHFCARHPWHTVIITSEGQAPLPRCGQCPMFVHHTDRHVGSVFCRRQAKAVAQRAAREVSRQAQEQRFYAYGAPLESVESFKYLGRILSNDDNDALAISTNVKLARKAWGRISSLLLHDGANPKTSGSFYLMVVLQVLLFGSETWCLTSAQLARLEGFHHRVARRISGETPRLVGQEWVHPPVAEALEACGLVPIREYLDRRHCTIVDHVATRPIRGEFPVVALHQPHRSGMRLQWWKRGSEDGGLPWQQQAA